MIPSASLDDPIRIPAAPEKASPPPFPVVSVVAPVVGAIVLWLVTGSALTLWFAALGPLLAIAGVLDGRRGARRSGRRREREFADRLAGVRREIHDRHEIEREAMRSRHPGVAWHMARPEEAWRTVASRAAHLVVGSGTVASGLRLTDGGDEDARVRALRADGRALTDAPVVVPLEAGIAVSGPPSLAWSVARGLVVQACLNLPPGELRVSGEACEGDDALPHRRAATGRHLQVLGTGQQIAVGVDVPVCVVTDDEPPPSRCGALLTLLSPTRARFDHGETRQEVTVEPLSEAQAAAVAASLAVRAQATQGPSDQSAPPLASLVPEAPAPSAGRLPAVIGVEAGTPVVIDLVSEGPHAVVIGVTGAGKSELLISWVSSLAARHTPQQVAFLLVDFKGGRSFDALLALPHVTGVLTDLDEAAALRAIESLRAEVRHRERVLASANARDVSECPEVIGRLVVVVDEYAALVAAHPTLHDLFADIAARGRALGMHLILASQRAAGVFRDAVLSNAPLRLALRVTDAGDSRAVLGCDDAAHLPGRLDDRGLCLVRSAADDAPRRLRVSRCAPDDMKRLVDLGAEPARRPWLPPLPARIALEEGAMRGRILIGIADEPEHQRQRPVELRADDAGLVVLGGPGTGKSSTLRVIARQSGSSIVVPSDPEAGWDALDVVEAAGPGTVVIADDLDLLLARLGDDHMMAARDRIERLVREARSRRTVVIASAQRATGPLGRIIDGMPRRLLLTHATRADYLAAGGESDHHAHLPAGRGHLDGRLVQVLWHPPARETDATAIADRDPGPDPIPEWHPGRQPVAFITPDGPRGRDALRRWSARGAAVARVDAPDADWAPGRVLWGSPDVWLAHWRSLNEARSSGLLLIDVACAPQYRSLTSDTALPPYADPHARRAWLRTPRGTVTRVRLPAAR